MISAGAARRCDGCQNCVIFVKIECATGLGVLYRVGLSDLSSILPVVLIVQWARISVGLIYHIITVQSIVRILTACLMSIVAHLESTRNTLTNS